MVEPLREEIPQGTLYLLILKTLALGENHGYGVALNIASCSGSVFQVEEGSLYPALQRMLIKGWVTAEWRITENNRRARYYKLTAAGRKQLTQEQSHFRRVTKAVFGVLEAG